jgi:hypothetical protein
MALVIMIEIVRLEIQRHKYIGVHGRLVMTEWRVRFGVGASQVLHGIFGTFGAYYHRLLISATIHNTPAGARCGICLQIDPCT